MDDFVMIPESDSLHSSLHYIYKLTSSDSGSIKSSCCLTLSDLSQSSGNRSARRASSFTRNGGNVVDYEEYRGSRNRFSTNSPISRGRNRGREHSELSDRFPSVSFKSKPSMVEGWVLKTQRSSLKYTLRKRALEVPTQYPVDNAYRDQSKTMGKTLVKPIHTSRARAVEVPTPYPKCLQDNYYCDYDFPRRGRFKGIPDRLPSVHLHFPKYEDTEALARVTSNGDFRGQSDHASYAPGRIQDEVSELSFRERHNHEFNSLIKRVSEVLDYLQPNE